MRNYKEPENVTRYNIIEFNNHGEIYYGIKCFYNKKKYALWGPIIEKNKMLLCDYGEDQWGAAYFRTIEEAQTELNAFCTGFLKRIIKEIEKRSE